MAKWILICAKCKSEFEHSQVGDIGMSQLELPVKPDVPTGATCVCPNCGHSATYLRTDLLYRSKASSS
jgi:DNA-directed RNA polymerase subunit RPC12/RpoP